MYNLSAASSYMYTYKCLKLENYSVPVKSAHGPWVLKYNLQLWLTLALTCTWDINCLYSSYYYYYYYYYCEIQCMGAYPGVGTCLGHYSTCTCTYLRLSNHILDSLPNLDS